jgi:hypothetical protein
VIVAERTRTVELRVSKREFANTLMAMRVWLDHNEYVPVSFDHGTERPDLVMIRVEFDDDDAATAFRAAFRGR